jgi:hypothetical protein
LPYVRAAWSKTEEEWYFSVVDVAGIPMDQPDTRHAAKYWSVLKVRLKVETLAPNIVCNFCRSVVG